MATLLLLFAWTLLPPPAWTALIGRLAEADMPREDGDRQHAVGALGEAGSSAEWRRPEGAGVDSSSNSPQIGNQG